jgi:hypothetical protein
VSTPLPRPEPPPNATSELPPTAGNRAARNGTCRPSSSPAPTRIAAGDGAFAAFVRRAPKPNNRIEIRNLPSHPLGSHRSHNPQSPIPPTNHFPRRPQQNRTSPLRQIKPQIKNPQWRPVTGRSPGNTRPLRPRPLLPQQTQVRSPRSINDGTIPPGKRSRPNTPSRKLPLHLARQPPAPRRAKPLSLRKRNARNRPPPIFLRRTIPIHRRLPKRQKRPHRNLPRVHTKRRNRLRRRRQKIWILRRLSSRTKNKLPPGNQHHPRRTRRGSRRRIRPNGRHKTKHRKPSNNRHHAAPRPLPLRCSLALQRCKHLSFSIRQLRHRRRRQGIRHSRYLSFIVANRNSNSPNPEVGSRRRIAIGKGASMPLRRRGSFSR